MLEAFIIDDLKRREREREERRPRLELPLEPRERPDTVRRDNDGEEHWREYISPDGDSGDISEIILYFGSVFSTTGGARYEHSPVYRV